MKKKILAVFLSLCMAMSLLPVTALAAENDVAQVGDKTYATLETAFSAAQNGQEIKLLNDVTLDKLISVTKTVTLDLNGHDITSNGPVFSMNTNGIEFTIRDKTNQGEIKSTENGQCNLIEVYNGELIVEGGNFSNNWYVIYVCQSGIATIKGGSLTSTVASVLSTNGSAEGNANYSGDAVMNVEGGTLTSVSDVTIYVPAGTLNVSGGTITGATAIYSKSGNTMITGGTIKGTGEKENYQHYSSGCAPTGDAIVVEACDYPNGEPVVNISGGTFESKSNQAVAKYYTEGNKSEGEIVVIGGTFVGSKAVDESSDITAYFPEGAILTQDEDGKVIPNTSLEESAVAKVNEVPYRTLESAIAAAKEGNTVQVVEDTTLSTSINVSTSITIDLNGCTVTGRNDAYSLRILGDGVEVTIDDNSSTGTGKITSGRNDSGGIVQVADAAKLTLESGTIEATGPNGGSPVLVIGKGGKIGADRAGATFNMTGGTLHANGYYALAGNGTWDGTNITISGGNIISNQCAAIYHPQEGKLTLTGGTISGTTAVQVCGGTLNIPENSTVVVTATGEDNRADKEGDGLIDDGAAISIVNRGSGYGDVKATIAGGTFRSENSEAVMSYAWANNAIDETGAIVQDFINGGNFSNPIDQAYLGDHLTAELYSLRNTEAPYSYYPTVDAALEDAQSGDKITSLEESSGETQEPIQVVKVTYVNGSKTTSKTVLAGEIMLPEVNDQGYNHFQGWNDGTTTYAGGAQVTISKDTTFTAVWSYIPPANPNYRIDIPAAEGGTVTADPAAAKAGAEVTLTATPDEGYAVGTITVTDRFGDAVKVTEQADGTYTFTMPNGQVTVKATFVETEEPAPAEPFPDVDENDWFYDEVVYVYENGLMNGVENNQFAPNTATNRAMLATILYRLAGEPAVSGDLPFTDVAAGTWYTDAVLWAAQNGIVNGLGENTFAPMNTLTREQLVTMLYRYAEAAGYDVSAAADLSGYPDAGKVQTYAQKAMSWAVAEGIVEGMDGNLNPAGNATRAQIATILMRFCEGVAK